MEENTPHDESNADYLSGLGYQGEDNDADLGGGCGQESEQECEGHTR
jgi:hypothetical protein